MDLKFDLKFDRCTEIRSRNGFWHTAATFRMTEVDSLRDEELGIISGSLCTVLPCLFEASDEGPREIDIGNCNAAILLSEDMPPFVSVSFTLEIGHYLFGRLISSTINDAICLDINFPLTDPFSGEHGSNRQIQVDDFEISLKQNSTERKNGVRF